MSSSLAFVNYFKRHPFGSQPAAMSILSILPPKDRCDILSKCLHQDPRNVDIYDKFALALLKAGMTVSAYELVDGAVAHGYMERSNGSVLREKLRSLDERYQGNFGSSTSYEQAAHALEQNIVQLRGMNALDAHSEFIDVMRSYITSRRTVQGPSQQKTASDAQPTGPSRVSRGAKSFLRKVYRVNGREVPVEVEESDSIPGRVLTGRYRQGMQSPFGGTMSMDQLAMADNLFAEVYVLIQCLDRTDLKQQDFWDAFVQLIVQHTNKYGRLVDVDLEGYIDTMLIVMDAITSAFGWRPLGQADGLDLRKQYQNGAAKAFRELIWVRDPSQAHFPGQPPKLVRLAER